MRILLVLCLLAATTQAAEYTVINKTVPYTVVNNTTPLSPKKVVRDTLLLDGVIYEQGDDGIYRAKGASGVAPSTFPGKSGQYNPSHRCPSCGYQSPPGQGTWIVRGFNANGSHNHSCPQCGTVWNH